MSLLHSLILGIVEGLTEFLPISSTAHLLLVGDLLKIPTTDFVKSFDIFIQLGAILAVVILYFKRIITNWNLIKKLVVAFIPTAIIGLLLYKIVKTYLLGNNYIAALALLIGGLILIIFEKNFYKKNPILSSEITYKQAFIIGCAQSLAIIPGVSRAAATIVGGLAQKIDRKIMVEFSFMLAIPTMVAAVGLDLIKMPTSFSRPEISLLAYGFIAAFVTAIIGVKFFIKFIQKNNFIPFGWYRIILGLIVLAWLMF
ncbi:MAG: undecaprenyl-diphosphatase UppP [Candidatus Falkowbacteria bacterium]|nr:undecaprenyl-diphosphatase UppP [Candidatus Falkowbacteria bacterium]